MHPTSYPRSAGIGPQFFTDKWYSQWMDGVIFILKKCSLYFGSCIKGFETWGSKWDFNSIVLSMPYLHSHLPVNKPVPWNWVSSMESASVHLFKIDVVSKTTFAMVKEKTEANVGWKLVALQLILIGGSWTCQYCIHTKLYNVPDVSGFQRAAVSVVMAGGFLWGLQHLVKEFLYLPARQHDEASEMTEQTIRHLQRHLSVISNLPFSPHQHSACLPVWLHQHQASDFLWLVRQTICGLDLL